jgi:hypothetical protein
MRGDRHRSAAPLHQAPYPLFHHARSHPPHQRMKPEERLDRHVDRCDKVVAAPDVAEFVGHNASISRVVRQSAIPSGSSRVGRRMPITPGSDRQVNGDALRTDALIRHQHRIQRQTSVTKPVAQTKMRTATTENVSAAANQFRFFTFHLSASFIISMLSLMTTKCPT